jgi:hypothetical protein
MEPKRYKIVSMAALGTSSGKVIAPTAQVRSGKCDLESPLRSRVPHLLFRRVVLAVVTATATAADTAIAAEEVATARRHPPSVASAPRSAACRRLTYSRVFRGR